MSENAQNAFISRPHAARAGGGEAHALILSQCSGGAEDTRTAVARAPGKRVRAALLSAASCRQVRNVVAFLYDGSLRFFSDARR